MYILGCDVIAGHEQTKTSPKKLNSCLVKKRVNLKKVYKFEPVRLLLLTLVLFLFMVIDVDVISVYFQSVSCKVFKFEQVKL